MKHPRISKSALFGALLLVASSLANAMPADAVERISQARRYYPLIQELSPDGRYLAYFENNQVWVKDFVLDTTEQGSVGTDGAAANGSSSNIRITPDGEWIAFDSEAYNFDSTDTWTCGSRSCRDIFIRNRTTGITEPVSYTHLTLPTN